MLVNGRFLSRRITGVERYGREILDCLGDKLRVVQPSRKIHGAAGHAWEQFSLPRQVQFGEILWSPANTGPLAVAKQVLTLHDLSALEHPEWYSSAFELWYRLLLPALVRRAVRVAVPSEWVSKQLRRRFSLPLDKVTVVPGGVNLNRFHPGLPAPSHLPARYVLFVGSLQPRKNLDTLLHAWTMIEHYLPGIWLVIAGGWDSNFRRIALPASSARVCFPGYIPEAELPAWYGAAMAFVLPSLDEGFGLPVLEAMASGTPVIAARAGGLPEVVGDAGLIFDPKQTAELAEALVRLCTNGNTSRTLAEKGLARAKAFNWQRSSEKLMEILQSCA